MPGRFPLNFFIHLTTTTLTSVWFALYRPSLHPHLYPTSLTFTPPLPYLHWVFAKLGERASVKRWSPLRLGGVAEQRYAPETGEQLLQKFSIVQETGIVLCLCCLPFAFLLHLQGRGRRAARGHPRWGFSLEAITVIYVDNFEGAVLERSYIWGFIYFDDYSKPNEICSF